MPRVTKAKPCEQLSPYVQGYWVVEYGQKHPIPELMIPYGCMDLAFFVGRSPKKMDADGRIEKLPFGVIAGQVSKPYHVTYQQHLTVYGVGFNPHTAHLLVKEASVNFTDEYVDACNFWPTEMPYLENRLREVAEVREGLRIIENFLVYKLSTISVPAAWHKVDRLINIWKDQNGLVDVAQVAHHFGVSTRYIEKLFKDHVGLRPMQYARILRFLNAIKQHEHFPEKQLTEIAYHVGYSDQSHFIRDFKNFTGQTPGQYFRTDQGLLDQLIQSESSSVLYNFEAH